jgi:hypothetical protein
MIFMNVANTLLCQETTTILDVLRHTASDSMRITVHSRTRGGSPIELANTPIILASSFTTGTEDITFIMSGDVHPSESLVHLIMDTEGGLGQIQWQTG